MQELYTVSSGFFGQGGHCTSIHLDLDDMALEVNTIISEDDFLKNAVRQEWNECAEEFNKNRPNDCEECPIIPEGGEVDFKEFITRFPNDSGWGWDDGNGKTGSTYLNITYHIFRGTRYVGDM